MNSDLRRWRLLGGLFALTTMLLSAGSCATLIWDNETAIRRGNITVQFDNQTRYRASFSFGTYDGLDLNPPGPVTLQQVRVEGNTISAAIDLPCRRTAAVATQAFVDRVVATRADQGIDFDADSFSDVINFSADEASAPGAALPTQGTANGMQRLLGIDYSCGDLLIFTFVDDPNAEGGFRVDFQVVVDTTDNGR